MKQQLVLSLRVLICAAIVIGGSAILLWLTGALQNTAPFPNYSLMVSAAGIFGIACLFWWATKPKV